MFDLSFRDIFKKCFGNLGFNRKKRNRFLYRFEFFNRTKNENLEFLILDIFQMRFVTEVQIILRSFKLAKLEFNK